MQSQHTEDDSNKIEHVDNNNITKISCINMDCRIRSLDDNDAKFKDTVVGRNERMLTDPCCLLIFISMIIIDVSIHCYAFIENANTEYLYKGHDYNGDICKHKTAWFIPNGTYIDITRCTDNCDPETIQSYSAQSFEKYWCVPNSSIPRYKEMYDNGEFDIRRGSATYARTIADLITQWDKIEWICWGSIIISIIYLLFIQLNQRLLAYIIMNIIFGFVAAVILMHHGHLDLDNALTDNTAIIEITEGAIILMFVLMISIWFIRDREALLTDIEMMAEAKEVYLYTLF